MANFCKKCGRPLENGRCPVCDGPAQPQYAPPASSGSGAAFFAGLGNDLRAFFASRDPFRIAPAAGFVVVALIYLLQAFFSLSDNGLSYNLYVVLSWLNLLSCIAVGVGAVNLVKGKATAGTALLSGCVSALMGLTGVLNLLGMLVPHSSFFNYLLPCLFILVLGLGLTVKVRLFRMFCLGGAAALALILLVEVFTTLPFLPQLALCWCALCGALAVVKGYLQV
ncbi:zinc ribbon domain-containing protein [Pseudoflavonifractor sp. CLA-AP-H29]|uniref:Zinc ribbon domain-containing protein n=1 Tax=Pseudoflavonifractor intestinihominis TaxID=3133171 RepID=A0ABV1E9D0_9FIRM